MSGLHMTVSGWPPLYITTPPEHEIRRGDGPQVIERLEALCTISKDSFAGPAGTPLTLREWQKQMLLRLFARRADGRRRYRVGLIGMPRKNGKSAVGSGLALEGLLFGGMGAEVYSAAASKDQARIVFDETKKMVLAKSELTDVLKPMRYIIEAPDTGSLYRVLASDAYTSEGLNITRALVDELHAHPNPELWNVLTLASAARIDPLVLAITTAGVMSDSSGNDSICYSLYKHGVDVAGGVVDDPSFFFCWWGAPDGADHTDPEVWAQANPGYGDLIDPEDFESAVRRTQENEFRTKRLNQWVSSASAWLPAGLWDTRAISGHVVAKDTRIVIGFDGSLSRDATAIVGCTIEPKPHVFVIAAWERPADAPQDWQVPRDDVMWTLREACLRWDVAEIAVDPALWRTEMQELEGERIPVVVFPQSSGRMAPATQRTYEMITEGDITHDGDPRLARHIRHAVLKRTNNSGAGGGHLYKDSRGSPRKIDLAVAMVMAVDVAMTLANFGAPQVWDLNDVMADLQKRAAEQASGPTEAEVVDGNSIIRPPQDPRRAVTRY
jgi:phage terminase large subunit-like protein